MNKELLKATFREYKKAAGLDYAITTPDSLGDCNSCVCAALCDKYGEDSRGIYAKHWERGMNGDGSLSRQDSVYIAHDLTDEQAKKFYEVFEKDYIVYPETYDKTKCFELFERSEPLYEAYWYCVVKGERERSSVHTARLDKACYAIKCAINRHGTDPSKNGGISYWDIKKIN